MRYGCDRAITVVNMREHMQHCRPESLSPIQLRIDLEDCELRQHRIQDGRLVRAHGLPGT